MFKIGERSEKMDFWRRYELEKAVKRRESLERS